MTCEHGYIGACPEGCDVPQGPTADELAARAEAMEEESAPAPVAFDEADCGGAFDGTRVISDADPGL